MKLSDLKKAKQEADELPELDEIFLSKDGGSFQKLNEGRKWVDGRFKKNIGIDQPTSGAGQQHAHVFGRKGKEIVVVSLDGTGSHGTKGTLHQHDAKALSDRGYKIRSDRVVEWKAVGSAQVLLG